MKAKFWAGGFLFDRATNSVLLHKRDGQTKFNPNKWAFFGGLNEGDERPEECFQRELREELAISVQVDDIKPLCNYLNEELQTHRYVLFIEKAIPKSAMVLGEGADFDWIPLASLSQYDLTDKTREDLKRFVETCC